MRGIDFLIGLGIIVFGYGFLAVAGIYAEQRGWIAPDWHVLETAKYLVLALGILVATRVFGKGWHAHGRESSSTEQTQQDVQRFDKRKAWRKWAIDVAKGLGLVIVCNAFLLDPPNPSLFYAVLALAMATAFNTYRQAQRIERERAAHD